MCGSCQSNDLAFARGTSFSARRPALKRLLNEPEAGLVRRASCQVYPWGFQRHGVASGWRREWWDAHSNDGDAERVAEGADIEARCQGHHTHPTGLERSSRFRY